MRSLLRHGAALTAAIFVLLVHPAAGVAQQFDVNGVVVDSAHAAIPGAMVVALTRADSTIAVFATTSGTGRFTLKRLQPGDYILQVTGIGYKPMRRDFSITTANITADTVVMMPAGAV